MNLSQIFFLLRRKKLNSFSDMTQRIELLSNVTQELNLFFLIDSENWTFSNMTQRIEPFSDVTQRIEPFFSNMTQRIEPFVLIWLKELNFSSYSQILTKKSQRSEPFWIWFKELNFVFKKKDSKNWPFFFLEKNSKIKNKIIELLNMTLRMEPSLFNMTLRIEPFFLIWLKQSKHGFKELNLSFFFQNFSFWKKSKTWTFCFKYDSKMIFLKKLLKEFALFVKTQRFFEKLDFRNWFFHISQIIELCLFSMPFFSLIQRIELFSVWRKALNLLPFNMTKRIEPFSFEYDATLFLEYDAKNLATIFFFQYDSKKGTFFSMTQRIELFLVWLEELTFFVVWLEELIFCQKKIKEWNFFQTNLT